MHIFIIFIDIDVVSANILNKERTLSELENEIAALSTIKSVLNSFTEKLNLNIEKLALLDDKELLEIMDSLTISKINLQINMNGQIIMKNMKLYGETLIV